MSARVPEAGLVAWLGRRFGPRITVRVNPDAFVFASRKSTVQVRTFIYLKESTGQLSVLAVGEDVPVVPGVFRIDLFGNGRLPSTSARSISRMECLEAFCRYGVRKVTGRAVMVRPHVTVIGLASLDAILHGYQAVVLQQALESAGASMVVFGESGAV